MQRYRPSYLGKITDKSGGQIFDLNEKLEIWDSEDIKVYEVRKFRFSMWTSAKLVPFAVRELFLPSMQLMLRYHVNPCR